jgi:hypothetical protein
MCKFFPDTGMSFSPGLRFVFMGDVFFFQKRARSESMGHVSRLGGWSGFLWSLWFLREIRVHGFFATDIFDQCTNIAPGK